MREVKEHPLLGRKYSEVKETHQVRLLREDGNNYFGTADFNPSRVNIEVDNDIITKVYFG